ncbi:protein LEKR1 isoform X2 [Synchiropus splendidus]|nr:protein LEKR1 isoform X2 [Synchiropus splendidus]XP_053729695.1 protein LEKR1 isoform X2 [Synchiropus splendidus]XP_053729696.1 protein LEKR1 isoform X2 [Synchiropus splendidus]
MPGPGTQMKTILSAAPANPLPDEITKMQRSEMVCRFCGVSYLIFHEFRQLQTQITSAEAELQELRRLSEREKARRESLEQGRLEWERALRLQLLGNSEEKQMETERALREDFELKYERQRRQFEDLCREQKEKELEELEAEWLTNHQKELERSEEREKVLTAALQTANKKVDELRKGVQQLEERLSVAVSKKEEAEGSLGEEQKMRKCLRDVCVKQKQALQATQSELGEILPLLSHMTGSWQAFRAHVSQHCSQVSSELEAALRHSSEELLEIRKEKEFLAEQLMKLRRGREELKLQHEDAERVLQENILRLKVESEERREKWLSCQQECNTLEEQLRSWQQNEAQLNGKRWAAEEEVARLRGEVETLLQEAREQRRQSELLKESHKVASSKMEEDYKHRMASQLAAALEGERSQNALRLKEELMALEHKLELQMTAEKQTHESFVGRQQRDKARLEQELAERNREIELMREGGKKERSSWKESAGRLEDAQRKLQAEVQHIRRQGELKLQEMEAELHEKAQMVSVLSSEVSVLQETVRRECMEREELAAALSLAHRKIRGLQRPSSASPPGNSLPQPHTRSLTLLSAPRTHSCGDPIRGGGGAGRKLEFWSSSGVSGRNKPNEGLLPPLKLKTSKGKRF